MQSFDFVGFDGNDANHMMGAHPMGYTQFDPSYQIMSGDGCDQPYFVSDMNTRDPLTREESRMQQSMTQAPGNPMPRKGSVYHAHYDRDTQRNISNFSGFQPTREDILAQFYGDMAYRGEGKMVNGLRPIRTFRGKLEQGEDLAKPRRVATRRNLQDRGSTGYGGIAFKRAVAMSNGQPAGGVGGMMMVPPIDIVEPELPWECYEQDPRERFQELPQEHLPEEYQVRGRVRVLRSSSEP